MPKNNTRAKTFYKHGKRYVRLALELSESQYLRLRTLSQGGPSMSELARFAIGEYLRHVAKGSGIRYPAGESESRKDPSNGNQTSGTDTKVPVSPNLREGI